MTKLGLVYLELPVLPRALRDALLPILRFTLLVNETLKGLANKVIDPLRLALD